MTPSTEALRMAEEWLPCSSEHAGDENWALVVHPEYCPAFYRPIVAEGIQGIMDERDDAKRMLLNSRCQNASLQAELAQKDAEIAALRRALEPFAKAADIKLCGVWLDIDRIGGTDTAYHITFGDLRKARAALAKEDGKHE